MKGHSTGVSSELNVQIDGQSAQSWSEILDQFEDANIYQSWAYGATRWNAGNLSHVVVRQKERIIAAAQLRIIRIPLLSAGIAYLRWGPLFQAKGQTFNSLNLKEIIECIKNEYCKRRGLSLQIIPNAYYGDPAGDTYKEILRQEDCQPNKGSSIYRTVLVDLNATQENIRKRLDQKWRNQLNRSERNDLILEVSDQPAAFNEFLRLYEVMWARKKFETSVNVTDFGLIQEALLGNQKMKIFLAKKDGHAVAALVCSLMGNTAIYLLGATDEKARELKAAYYLQWQAMLWLKDHGACWYDLGGIDPVANPGGYHFKSGFNGKDVTQLPQCYHHDNFLSQNLTALIGLKKKIFTILHLA